MVTIHPLCIMYIVAHHNLAQSYAATFLSIIAERHLDLTVIMIQIDVSVIVIMMYFPVSVIQ